MAKQVTTIHVEDKILNKLDEWANRNDRSRNWVVNQALVMFLEENEKLTYTLQQKAGKR